MVGLMAGALSSDVASTPRATTGVSLPAGVTLKPIDGGQTYYDKWPASSFPGATTMFPVTRWAADAKGAADDSTLINTYLEDGYMTPGWQDDSHFYGIGDTTTRAGGELVADEADQWAGDGWGSWSGQVGFGTANMCTDGTLDCGYTALKSLSQQLSGSKFKYANFGKYAGTQGDSRNWLSFTQSTDVASSDVYFEQEGCILAQGWWGVNRVIVGDSSYSQDLRCTDPTNLDPRIRLSRNYGRLVFHERQMQGGTKPIYSFNELTGQDGNEVNPATFTAGLWSAVIEGARGINYFTHNFVRPGGASDSFEDPAFAGVKAAAQSFYTTAQSLAPVLNGPDAVGLVTSSADRKTPDGDPAGPEYLAKWNSGHPYIFAHDAADSVSNASVTFALAGSIGTSVSVLGENRTIPVVNGQFTDTFANTDSVHIYRVDL
ncbi:hypothetical protein [Sinomonas susongensis]|uniref:hypothetical protein n=1 Tax=Sinomonas susongensis TaxID=1324851 RepID=UPI00110981F8|nr:hypothetical protein [Sinomonas susongensis]